MLTPKLPFVVVIGGEVVIVRVLLSVAERGPDVCRASFPSDTVRGPLVAMLSLESCTVNGACDCTVRLLPATTKGAAVATVRMPDVTVRGAEVSRLMLDFVFFNGSVTVVIFCDVRLPASSRARPLPILSASMPWEVTSGSERRRESTPGGLSWNPLGETKGGVRKGTVGGPVSVS